MGTLDRDAAREVLVRVGRAIPDSVSDKLLDALESCVRPDPPQTIDRDGFARVMLRWAALPVRDEEGYQDLNVLYQQLSTLLRPAGKGPIDSDALVREVIEECARDVEATASTNDGELRYELMLAAHSLRTQVAAAFDIENVHPINGELPPWIESIQRNGDFQTITFTDGSSVYVSSEQDEHGRWRDGRGLDAVFAIAAQAGVPAPKPVDPYRDGGAVLTSEEAARVAEYLTEYAVQRDGHTGARDLAERLAQRAGED